MLCPPFCNFSNRVPMQDHASDHKISQELALFNYWPAIGDYRGCDCVVMSCILIAFASFASKRLNAGQPSAIHLGTSFTLPRKEADPDLF